MSAKAQRRSKRRAKAAQKRPPEVDVRELSETDRAALPPLLKKMQEYETALDAYLSQSSDLRPLKSIVQQDITRIVGRITDLIEPFDAIDVLEYVRSSESPGDLNQFVESEHEGLAIVIELIAAILATRPTGNVLAPVEGSPRPNVMVIGQELVECARSAVVAESVGIIAKHLDKPQGHLIRSNLRRELYFRSLEYPHIATRNLLGLFGTPAIADLCNDTFGCTVGDVVAVFDSITKIATHRITKRRDELEALVRNLPEGSQPINPGDLLTALTRESDPSDHAMGVMPEEIARGFQRLLFDNPGDVSLVGTGEIVAQSGVDESVVESVLNLFSVDVRSANPQAAAREVLNGKSPFRSRPLLRTAPGAVVPVHLAALNSAIREQLETSLKLSPESEIYYRHRSAFLENRAVELLLGVLPGAEVLPKLEYFGEPQPVEPGQTEPAQTFECDALIWLDDIAIVVEAKSGALSSPSRAGRARAFRNDLVNLVGDATDQSRRVLDLIRNDGGLTLKDGTWLDLSHIREVHAIAVTLEELSGIATTTSDLVDVGLVPSDWHPWIVSLHDLEVTCQLIARPAELVVYLRRRTNPETSRVFMAMDELDYLLEFFASGLYVEPKPSRSTFEGNRERLGGRTAARRRREADVQTFLGSRTDALDAYFLYDLGYRRKEAPKPSLNAVPSALILVDDLASLGQAGWLSSGAALLDSCSAYQYKAAGYVDDVIAEARSTGVDSKVVVGGQTIGVGEYLMVWQALGEAQPLPNARNSLARYVSAKKHQLKCTRAVGMLFSTGPDASMIWTTFDNRPLGPDADLDRIIRELKLRPPSSGLRPLPPKGKRTRRGRV